MVVREVELLVDVEGITLVEGADAVVVGDHDEAVRGGAGLAEPTDGIAPSCVEEAGGDGVRDGDFVGAGAAIDGGGEEDATAVRGEGGGAHGGDGLGVDALVEVGEVDHDGFRAGALWRCGVCVGAVGVGGVQRGGAEELGGLGAILEAQAHVFDGLAVGLGLESLFVVAVEPDIEEGGAGADALAVPGDNLAIGGPGGGAIPSEGAGEVIGALVGVIDGENPDVAVDVVILHGGDQPTAVRRPVVGVDTLDLGKGADHVCVEVGDDDAAGVLNPSKAGAIG